MNNRVSLLLGTVLVLLLVAGPSFGAEDRCEVHHKGEEASLCSYEPTTVGYTWDRDDSGFMDFTISVRYQLFPVLLTRFQNWVDSGLGDNTALYFAFTGRFGQYIKTRDSSPVVEKLFNPKLFYRYWMSRHKGNYLDVAFAHESNGQSIDSLQEYQAALANAQSEAEVKDQLSRGWDYWEVVWKETLYERPAKNKTPAGPGMGDVTLKQVCSEKLPPGSDRKEKPQTSITSTLGYKYFLKHGPLEGTQENYNAWENDPEGKRFDRVNGLSLLLKWTERGQVLFFNDLEVAGRFETGVREPFRFKTWRFEVGTKVVQLPVVVWEQIGYNSDLAQYYKNVRSYGFQVEIGSF